MGVGAFNILLPVHAGRAHVYDAPEVFLAVDLDVTHHGHLGYGLCFLFPLLELSLL